MSFLKTIISVILYFIFTFSIFAQGTQEKYFQGFTEEVSGKRFGYHSPLPSVNSSLIVRGQEDYDPISWKTEIVPEHYNGDFVKYIWMFGRDVSAKTVQFHLYVNDEEYFSFTSSKTSIIGEEIYKGKNSAELILNTTMLDKYEDQMGFAILKLPTDLIKLGQQNIIKISANPTENAAWFMTYKSKVEENIKIYQNNVVAKQESKLFHSISADFIHIGDPQKAIIKIDNKETEIFLKAGYNKAEILLPKVEETKTFIAEIKRIGHEIIRIPFELNPVREWEIYLVQHTHTDAGYTRPQDEILPVHLQYIDNALDYCDMTDDYPDAAKFRWTCETSWSIREYLKSRPQAQIDRLVKRLQEDRIEATGMFFNFSEIIDESALVAQTKTLRMLKNKGIEVNTAMQNDVNGIAWCLVDYYNNTDVKYLTMGIHAHRARLPFNKPTAFWWESPAGNRLLAYRSEHYQHGNILSLTSGQQDVLRTNLSNYLTGLEDKNYPYNKISLQFSGYITDNSPPSSKVCDIIKEWNEKYEWPKLRSAVAKDFMIYLDEYHHEDIESQKVAWPDWWTDGVASACNETKLVRNTQMDISANTAILSMAKMLGANFNKNIHDEITTVYDNLLFYNEHTHGAAESITDPLSQNTVNQWNMKAAYAWEAAKRSTMLQEKALANIEPYIQKSNKPLIAVFNTLNWERSNLVELFIEHEILPEGKNYIITDKDGKEIPNQVIDRRMEGAYYQLWVENIPAMGYKTLQINAGEKSIKEAEKNNSFGEFENKFYKIDMDTKRGFIHQIYDKELQTNLIDSKDSLNLGEVIYEQLDNRHDMERLNAASRDTVYKSLNAKYSLMKNTHIHRIENGQIFKSIFIKGDLPICADERGVTIEIRLYHYQKKIEILYQMFKLGVSSPEGVYVSFPFELNKAQLAYEAQGGVVYPGKNQLAGTSADWNTIQNFASVRNDNSQIVFVSNEIPLVHFSNLNIGRFYYRLKPKTNHIYSWVLNNYWVTNFKAKQEGELRWKYAITSSSDNSDMFASKFGWGERMPIFSRVILPRKGVQDQKLVSRSLINIDVPNLLLVTTNLSLDGKGIILHLREIEGDHAILDIRRILEETGASSAEEVNVLEESMSILTTPLLIEHFETKFIKLNFE